MPLVGFTCPSHGESPGRDNAIDYCLTQCKSVCAAPHVLAGMMQDEEADYHKDRRISVTMLTGGCKRRTLIERMAPFYALPKSRLPTYRGRLIHSLVEDTRPVMEKLGWMIEMHMELPVTTKSGQWKLTATLDALDPTMVLYDIKTFQDYALTKMVTGANKGTWSDHIPDQYVKQMNLYRYLLHVLHGVAVSKMRIQIMTFGDLVLTGTSPVVGIRKGYKWTQEQYEIPDVPMVEDDLVQHWINHEGDMWYRIMYEGEKAPIRDTEWEWLCKYCQFKGTQWCPDPDAEAGTHSK